MRISLMIASGRLDGPIYLEDAVEVSILMAQSGRMPPMDRWVTAANNRAAWEQLGSFL